MERLTQEDFRALLQCLREIYAYLDLEAFKVQVIEALSKVIPAEVIAYSEIDLPGQRVAVVAKPPEALPPDTERILGRHLHEHPLIDHYQRTHDSRAVKLSDLLTQRQFHRLALYHELYRLMGAEHLITVWLPSPSPPLISISSIRGWPDFSERDRLMLNLLHPHFHLRYLES